MASNERDFELMDYIDWDEGRDFTDDELIALGWEGPDEPAEDEDEEDE
jgi:hypothetical protein